MIERPTFEVNAAGGVRHVPNRGEWIVYGQWRRNVANGSSRMVLVQERVVDVEAGEAVVVEGRNPDPRLRLIACSRILYRGPMRLNCELMAQLRSAWSILRSLGAAMSRDSGGRGTLPPDTAGDGRAPAQGPGGPSPAA